MGKPLRILQVIGIMNRGGAETMIMNLYRAIDKGKIQFDFVENTLEDAEFDEEIRALGGKIYKCPHYNGKNHLQYVQWWKNFYKEHKEYSIVHGHIGSTAAIYLQLAKKYGLYTIAHSHSDSTNHTLEGLLYGMFSYPTRFIADYFFGCSERAGEKRYGKRIVENKKRFKVLNNAIHVEKFSYDPSIRDKIRKSLGIENEIVFGHIGRMDENKNQKFLIDLLKKILLVRTDIKLLLVGTGKTKEILEQKVAEEKLEDYAIFTGVRSDVPDLLQGMDVFVFPSIYEGLPVTLIEAQAAGLPCIISDTITDEVILTDLVKKVSLNSSTEEWIESILNNTSVERQDMSSFIIENGYDIKNTAKELEEFYLNVSRM